MNKTHQREASYRTGCRRWGNNPGRVSKSGEQYADVLTKAIDAKSVEKHARFLLNVR